MATGSGARLDSTISAMSRARVWTNSFAAHIQREAIVKEGPLQAEELGHVLETVAQREASNRAAQFARGLPDAADEELVVSPETFATAGAREPDLAEAIVQTRRLKQTWWKMRHHHLRSNDS